MDGYEAMRRIRARADGKDVKIIAVTASIFGDTSRGALWAGSDDIILKPFRDSELYDKIGNLLGAEYIYEEEYHAATEIPQNNVILKPVSSASLPRELVGQLREAAVNGDFHLLSELCGRVEEQDTHLAGVLRELAAKYDTQNILAVLKG